MATQRRQSCRASLMASCDKANKRTNCSGKPRGCCRFGNAPHTGSASPPSRLDSRPMTRRPRRSHRVCVRRDLCGRGLDRERRRPRFRGDHKFHQQRTATLALTVGKLTLTLGKTVQGALNALRGFTESLHAGIAEYGAALVGDDDHHHPAVAGQRANQQVLAGK